MKNGLFESLSGLKDVLQNYVTARVNLWKIILIEKLARTGTAVITSVTVLTFTAFFILFLIFAFSFWYGEKYGSLAAGFLISGGFFLFLALIVILFRKPIFSGMLIKGLKSVLFSDNDKEK
ncbi:MAG: hypothetical protein HC905_25475 [Bacteroidales bacterium]|nr:hypothetical protein [Bacteroidales bacterium]